MPPKKAAVTTLVGEYGVELMTENELKTYVEALIEEHGRMRKSRNLYQKDNNELLNFCKIIHDDMIHNKTVGVQKNLELQDHIFEQEKKLKLEDKLVHVIEMENINQAEKETLEAYINLVTKKIHNKEIEQELLKDISEKDREIEHLAHTNQLISIQSKDNYFSTFEKTSKTFKSTFENLVAENHKSFLETCEKFSQQKIKNLQAIWEDIPMEDNNLYSGELSKMLTFFKDIYWKNIKTIEKLQSTLTDLEKELKHIILNIRDVLKENRELAFEDYLLSPRESLLSDPSFCPNKIRNLKDLACDNYLLNMKLEMLNKENHDLKRKYVTAMRRIYQIADFKSLLLEKKLFVSQNYGRKFT